MSRDFLSAGNVGNRRLAWTCLALAPALAVTVATRGNLQIVTLLALAASAWIADAAGALMRGERKGSFRPDSSGVPAGLVFALCLPAGAPLTVTVPAIALAVLIAKQLPGGPGRHVFHPGMVALAALAWARPFWWHAPLLDATGSFAGASAATWMALACALGAAVLLWRRIVRWPLPAGVLIGASAASAASFLPGQGVALPASQLLLLAFFIAPVGADGNRWSALFAGTITGALCTRLPGAIGDLGALPFAALLGNALAPWWEGFAATRWRTSTTGDA